MQSAFVSGRAIEKWRCIGIGFGGMENLAQVATDDFARAPGRRAQEIQDKSHGRPSLHRQCVMDGQSHVYCQILSEAVGQRLSNLNYFSPPFPTAGDDMR